MYSTPILDIPNMSTLAVTDNETYAMNRKKGFGASDSSILLGVNKWTKLDALIEQKNLDYISEDELAVGLKPNVRMGADLEPLILQKAGEFFNTDLIVKPDAQYRLEEYPYLTINYDGMLLGMPVEAKCVSTFARKYWKWENSCKDVKDFESRTSYNYSGNSMRESVEVSASEIGIPPYYYTQCQQQLIGTTKKYCALVAMDVKEWTLHVFKVWENEEVQQAIICAAAEAAASCNKIRPYLL